jgi:tagatose 1,6-diphosphate aldolase GatY/KbaY
MRTALEAGAGAVMADGSALPDADNAALVRSAVELAAAYGAGVEAELGRIEGDEDVTTAVAAGALTDPEQATPFVAVTGAACLAVSIGNVHGAYRAPPDLDWERLATLRQRVAVRSRSTALPASLTATCAARSRSGSRSSTSTPSCASATST